MSDHHRPALPPRPRFVEQTHFDRRNNVLYLLLGLISVSERVLSVVPDLVEAPKEQDAPAPAPDNRAGPLLR